MNATTSQTTTQTHEQLDRQLTELVELLRQIRINLSADEQTRTHTLCALDRFVERDAAGEELTIDDLIEHFRDGHHE